ncbi:hypothetical protein [Streptomyces avermitilis]|uniref:Uncharacterized protein n=1 Tax=Streptomyces avermitilis TaxID=33903 RepID=A0A4D4M9T3_STRAX|nr:hypothetical protein [Streptomyces avermitilis]GDY68618.1 hypothetical protein SAV14893_080110 [Streptomyces avermitilis]GDY71007.1 hypothetical protein SAV31267_004920 [Streptomyces avermitilis]
MALTPPDPTSPGGQFGAMRSVWGVTTRQTVIGVKCTEHAITYHEVLTLHDLNPTHTFVGGLLAAPTGKR